MSVLGDIVSGIFHRSASPASAAPAGGPSPQSKPTSAQAAPAGTPSPQSKPASAQAASGGTPSPQSKSASAQAAPPATPGSPVDVAAIMDKLAAQSKEKLDWRKSIVDLMKLLNLDSGMGARKRLAEELHYTGNLNDSASMNVWLHKQVMIKLAENGGRIPNELRS
jgi:Domain of unknown function (DUF3597)